MSILEAFEAFETFVTVDLGQFWEARVIHRRTQPRSVGPVIGEGWQCVDGDIAVMHGTVLVNSGVVDPEPNI